LAHCSVQTVSSIVEQSKTNVGRNLLLVATAALVSQIGRNVWSHVTMAVNICHGHWQIWNV